jgi:dethiobiotin synthetase
VGYTGTVANCFGNMDVREENLRTLKQHLPGAFTVV